jgi:hypothetical protein
MATHKISSTFFLQSETTTSTAWSKYLAFVDTQTVNAVAWWLGSLLLHGCILVPLTFLLVYSMNGPALLFLFISMVAFFVNVIANMGGAAFRFTFNSLIFSIILHVMMVMATLAMVS